MEMCRCVAVEMCRCGDVEMWRCVDMELWRCGCVEMWMWRFGVIDAAKLCLWLVDVLQYKTNKFSVYGIESYLY